MQAITTQNNTNLALNTDNLNIDLSLITNENLRLDNDFAQLMDNSLRKNSKRSYMNSLSNTTKTGFFDICVKFGIDFREYPLKAVATFITEMLNSGKSINTIKNRLSAVNRVYENQGFYNLTKNHQIKDLLKGTTNVATTEQTNINQAKAFDYKDLKKVIRNIDTSTNKGKRDNAIILVGTYLGLRRSEIANLKRSDISDIKASLNKVCLLYTSDAADDW